MAGLGCHGTDRACVSRPLALDLIRHDPHPENTAPSRPPGRSPGSDWCPSLARSPLGERIVVVMRDTFPEQQKCMAAPQRIHEHLGAIEDEVPLLLTEVRPVLLEIAIGRPSVDYRTLVEDAEHPNSVELRRSLLQTAIDAVALMEAIDDVSACEPAADDTAEVAAYVRSRS